MIRALLVLSFTGLVPNAIPSTVHAAQGVTVGFEERFALASDRTRVLGELAPGGEDFYFYSCLDRQQRGDLEAVPRLLAAWIERHGRNARVQEIETRQALLGATRDPAATFRYLSNRLGLRFDDARPLVDESPGRPSALDPGLISPAAWMDRALANHANSLDGLRDQALGGFAARTLDDNQLMLLLQRWKRPDLPNLPALVARNLKHKQSGGFGSLPIHGHLLRAQLDELAQLAPALLGNTAFVNAYAERLAPSEDADGEFDAREREAWLDRLWAFAQRLPPAQNTFKAHVLYHRLEHDLAAGRLDRERFFAYLRLPRPFAYVREALRRRSDELVRPDTSFETGFDTVVDDEPLVRRILEHFLAADETWAAFEEYVQEDYLRRAFATAKVLSGAGDLDRWYALFADPAEYQRLLERVEIEFAPTRRLVFASDEAVGIDVDVKNVPVMLVRVFALDAYGFQRDQDRDLDLSIDLDGLVASEESTYRYDEPPHRRVRRHFDFESLRAPGSYVVEFIGNGVASRVFVQKGRLRYVERRGAAGHVLTVLDDRGEIVPGASAWCAGREHVADGRGEVNIPYGAESKNVPLVLRRGALSTLERLHIASESYELQAGVFVGRESLLAGAEARLLVRPSLRTNGVPIPISLLESPTLVIGAVDHEGITTQQTVRGLKLASDAEFVHVLAVPAGLARLSVRLTGRVQDLSRRVPVDVGSPVATFDVNAIDARPETACPLLGRTSEGWFVDWLGKNGEPVSGRGLTLRLVHEDFADPFDAALQTDARGRIRLGALNGIVSVEPLGLPHPIGAWRLADRHVDVPRVLHGVAGETIAVPLERDLLTLERGRVGLFEVRAGSEFRDAFERLALAGGGLELRGLEPGQYALWLPDRSAAIDVLVTSGPTREGRVFGRSRWLQLEERTSPRIVAMRIEGDRVRIDVSAAGPRARVHVWATRFVEPFAPEDRLGIGSGPSLDSTWVSPERSEYEAGRRISDEYRYILGRRDAAKYLGNMLRRPSLLLNPWSPEETTTESARRLGGGSRKGRSGGGTRSGGGGGGGPSAGGSLPPAGQFPNLDFLPAPAPIVANLRPDGQGVVRVSRAELGSGSMIHALVVDDLGLCYASSAAPEVALQAVNRRLETPLDPRAHVTEQRGIEFVDGGGAAVIEDPASARTEVLGSLTDVFRAFQALSGNSDLETFEFLTRWPTLTEDEKRELYSKHACHELHFFLRAKDRPFFEAVVRPFLANKLERAFLDDWLLDLDLKAYLEPWAYGRLNLVEKILLCQRVPAEKAGASREVRERLELVPPDPARATREFQTLLSTGALDAGRKQVPSEQDSKDQAGLKAKDEAKPGWAANAPAPGSPPPAAAEAEAEKLADKSSGPSAGGPAGADAELRRAKGEMDDLERRAEVREAWRPADRTRQYVEHEWWHRRIHEQGPDMIPVNAFWRDFAAAPAGAPFRSTHVAQPTSSVAEMLLALSVLDLPFTAAEPARARDGRKLVVRPATPMLFVRSEIRPANAPSEASPVLIGQNYFRLDDRYRFEGGERRDRFVTGEFLTGVGYGCQVVLTNPTSTPRALDLNLQVPGGSIGIDHGFVTRGRPVLLGAFATVSIEYSFYFPAPGVFAHYPAHVGSGGAWICAADATNLTVVPKATTVDTSSWEHVSQSGSLDEVERHLESANLRGLDLGRVAWRMRDRASFARLIVFLRARHVYDDRLWSYALFHGDVKAAREYLEHSDALVADCGGVIDSPLLTSDASRRGLYEHVEFDPLFLARAHPLGRERTIQNVELAAHYRAWLALACRRPTLDSEDWLRATYHLLLQDRIEEALAAFARVDAQAIQTRLQYDYLSAYLDFFTDQRAHARRLAEAHRDEPVPHWRARFRDVLAQLDEAEGQASGAGDAADRTRRQTDLARTEPALELEVAGNRVTLSHANLAACEVRYYRLDVEFAFSTNPFTEQGSGTASYVRPARRDEIGLDPHEHATTFELPAEFKDQNVLVEARGAGILRRRTAFASALDVQTVESYGQLVVTNAASGRPAPKTYVKVYARLPGGVVRFHKDGYTDLRGRFDYASVSEPTTANAERYAVLVLGERDGAVIREVTPPGR